MWMLKDSPGLLMDLYELSMAQVYFEKGMCEEAYFEVTIRKLPKNWGFFCDGRTCGTGRLPEGVPICQGGH
jgi:nicotinic acid phosphoribosyltransferase